MKRPADVARSMNSAAANWYAAGFAAGAAGASVMTRKGRPRRRAMWPAWRGGIADGQFALAMFKAAYAAGVRETLVK